MANRRRRAKGKRVANREGHPARADAKELQGLSVEEFSLEEYSGELPHPEILQRFDEIVPGSAKTIFDEMQANASHRRKQENRIARANTWTFSFAVVATHLAEIALLAFGGVLIWYDKPIQGFALLVGQVALLRWGKKG